jgi:hypothetical protein
MRLCTRSFYCLLATATVGTGVSYGAGQSELLSGAAAFGDWRADKPGVVRIIKPEDLPRPGATPSASNFSHIVPRPAAAVPLVPPGFKIELLAEGLMGPREMRVAPNGDVFISETEAGRIRILRLADGGAKVSENEVYANGLNKPFGIAFFPSGNDPQWVYVANTDSIVRFPYRAHFSDSARCPH